MKASSSSTFPKVRITVMLLMSVALWIVWGSSSSDPTVLSLGDSYTIGEGVPASERWPLQLVAQLKAQNHAMQTPQIIAKTGWTTDELQAELGKASLQPKYDWVTLLIGVNNQYRNRDVEAFRKEFRELLIFAIEKAGENPRRVIVLSIPDWGVTPFAEGRDRAKIAEQIDLYNRVKREETEKLRAHYVEITDITRRATEDPKRLLTEDGLHPSGAMYGQWAERAAKVIADQLRSESQ
jgi:lysophospholipase L1-like esterase